MTESDLFKNTAGEHHHHHGEHHSTSVPDALSNDGSNPISESTQEDDKHGHLKEERRPKERKTTMKNRIAQTLTSLVVSILLSLSLLSASDKLLVANLLPEGIELGKLQTAELLLNGLELDNLQLANLQLDNLQLSNLLEA